jgi:hypothetical protein
MAISDEVAALTGEDADVGRFFNDLDAYFTKYPEDYNELDDVSKIHDALSLCKEEHKKWAGKWCAKAVIKDGFMDFDDFEVAFKKNFCSFMGSANYHRGLKALHDLYTDITLNTIDKYCARYEALCQYAGLPLDTQVYHFQNSLKKDVKTKATFIMNLLWLDPNKYDDWKRAAYRAEKELKEEAEAAQNPT